MTARTKSGKYMRITVRTYQRLRARIAQLRARLRDGEGAPPSLPPPNAEGNYPARATLRAILARQLMERRKAAGLTQAQLAALAGVRQETLSRLETGKHAPNVATVDKIEAALKKAER